MRNIPLDSVDAIARAVLAIGTDYPPGTMLHTHSHRRAQFLYGATGVMEVGTDDGAWVVPPQRGVWIPAGKPHRVRMLGVSTRSLYIEPRDVPAGNADVVVCDGFTGNVILKLTEGVAKMLVGELKGVFMGSLKTKLAYLMVKDGMRGFKKKLDADEHGGALMMGVSRPVIKAHGSSNAKAFYNAIRQAKLCVERGAVDSMREKLAALGARDGGEDSAED